MFKIYAKAFSHNQSKSLYYNGRTISVGETYLHYKGTSYTIKDLVRKEAEPTKFSIIYDPTIKTNHSEIYS